MPAVEYEHDVGCAVIGGYVYRGCRLPDLRGTYFYADYCGAVTGLLRSFVLSGGVATDPRDWHDRLPETNGWGSFGEDARGELYLIRHTNGRVYRLVPDP